MRTPVVALLLASVGAAECEAAIGGVRDGFEIVCEPKMCSGTVMQLELIRK